MNVKTVYCFVFLIWFCVTSQGYGAAAPEVSDPSYWVPLPKERRIKGKDICKLPEDGGLCNANMKRFYYNSQSKKCAKFSYGGCTGNENNFKTLEECKKACERK